MREKELRIALVCYGGVSLAVYMHGITKEIWRLARASQNVHSSTIRADQEGETEAIYAHLLRRIALEADTDIRILVDILAGASAGGINAVFLGHAIATGEALDPLTDLWLDSADVDALLAEHGSGLKRFVKSAAVPVAWLLSSRSGTIDKTVEPAHRAEVKAKLANFVRAPWLQPPFGGAQLTNLLLDAFDAMAKGPKGAPLLPDYQPLDLFITVTDFNGYPERLRLNSPAEVIETEHRLIISFQDPGGAGRRIGDPAELVYAARATASFPGAFPPFRVGELDQCLEKRGQAWPGRDAFLARTLPRRHAMGEAEQAILIDGSVLHNRPFGPATAALEKRPARREVDRRFVYIDPKPGMKSVRLTSPGGSGEVEPPGFLSTLFGALSDIPREQPIRDNLEGIKRISARVRRLRWIMEAIRPEVEAAIERAVGSSFFLSSPTPSRLASWRTKAHNLSAREAGYAYAAYGQLKLATVIEEVAACILRLGGGGGDSARRHAVREAVWTHVRALGLTDPDAMTARGARDDVVQFLVDFDLTFRTRRLRFVARRITETTDEMEAPREEQEDMLRVLHAIIARYRDRDPEQVAEPLRAPFVRAAEEPAAALAALRDLWLLETIDAQADEVLSDALLLLPKADRRGLILAYLGYPYYDIATLPLLQGEGLDEFDPIKVDRISPNDAVAIRAGGAAATLKGIQFNSFGAFFSRAYRENDYLWGRLHGADRLIDIVNSAVPEGKRLAPAAIAELKRDAFRAILTQERGRLTHIDTLFAELEREVG
ncbi:MAG TPA: patatin-like protein [Allosphingosinicella sp.]|nr:patatin-like protein [Allosphingosinicella sp.]